MGGDVTYRDPSLETIRLACALTAVWRKCEDAHNNRQSYQALAGAGQAPPFAATCEPARAGCNCARSQTLQYTRQRKPRATVCWYSVTVHKLWNAYLQTNFLVLLYCSLYTMYIVPSLYSWFILLYNYTYVYIYICIYIYIYIWHSASHVGIELTVICSVSDCIIWSLMLIS